MSVECRPVGVFCCCGYREIIPEPPEGMAAPIKYSENGLFGHDYLYLTRCPNFGHGCDEKYPNVDEEFCILIRK